MPDTGNDRTSDSVNDVAGSGEPSFVHIAICTGTDLDGAGVTLVDRLCLNDPAVHLIADDMNVCVQQQKAFIGMLEADDKEISKLKTNENAWTMISFAFFMAFAAMLIFNFATRKAS